MIQTCHRFRSATAAQQASTPSSLLSSRLCTLMASSAAGDSSLPPPPPPLRGWISGLVSGAGRLLAAVLDPDSSASDTTTSSPESSQSPPRRALVAAGTRSPFLSPRSQFRKPREMLAPYSRAAVEAALARLVFDEAPASALRSSLSVYARVASPISGGGGAGAAAALQQSAIWGK